VQHRFLTDQLVEVRADGDTRKITGYAAVYDSMSHDLGGFREIIKRGAFDRSLKEVAEGKRTVSARVQHEGGLSTVGSTANGSLRLWSDARGLKYEMTPPNTNAGRDLIELVSGGYINKSSFAFTVSDRGKVWDFNQTPPLLTLTDVDLIDVAPVDGPAYEDTIVEMRNLITREIQYHHHRDRRIAVETRALDGGNEVDLYILDEIVPTWVSRYMQDAQSSGKIIEALSAVPDVRGITVYVNSPGGDVFESMAIYNTLKQHPAPVTVKVQGLAASGAGLIAMAGDHIEMGEGSFIMVHNAWGGVVGNSRDMKAAANLLEKIDGEQAAIIAGRSGVDESQARKWINAETWFTGEEAVAAGLATSIGAPATIDVEDGERCRAAGYRNVPDFLGGAQKRELSEMSIDELRHMNKEALAKQI
jgi:HK97 family phage prohead protease